MLTSSLHTHTHVHTHEYAPPIHTEKKRKGEEKEVEEGGELIVVVWTQEVGVGGSQD